MGSIRSRLFLLSCGTAALAGVAVAASGGVDLTRARKGLELGAMEGALTGSDSIPICATPTGGGSPLRIYAAIQSEVSKGTAAAATATPEFADQDPSLMAGIGTATFKITTAVPEAQTYFDQGLRLAYAFNHAEAQRAFRKAQRLDPQCAMCFWGEAFVLGPNINLPMPEEAVAPAFAAVGKAQAAASGASAKERALVAALALRYTADPKAARAPFDNAFADAMGKVAAQYPDDNEIATLHAEALMDLSPWDYWQPGGREPKPQSAAIVPTLEGVLARDPAHIGAIHLYIHAVEASDRPERAEPYADRMRGAVPNAGHLVHMPSHIYLRLGRYLDALQDNRTAAAVDEKYLADSKAPMGMYRLGYYPHNVHFVLAAAQMAGDGPAVIAAAEKLGQLIPDEVARGIPPVHPVKAAPYYAHAQFSPPDVILALKAPDATIPYVKAMWHYARGVALAGRGDAAGAAAEAAAIAAIEKATDFAPFKAVGVPAQDVLKLARTLVEGRIAQAGGDAKAAVERFEEAAALQDGLPYTEPPYWYYPVRQSLAAALLQAGKPDAAEEQFRRALRRAPNSGWSYFGLAQVFKARGNAEEAGKMEVALGKTWIGDRSLLQLPRL